MLKHDPTPWLLSQEGGSALRARRSVGLEREGDSEAVRREVQRLAGSQLTDGSFGHSPMQTAGVVCLLADLGPELSTSVLSRAAEFLFGVLQSQPGYDRPRPVRPGALATPCDLGGFFGPYGHRNLPEVMADGAREMNFYRTFEPLLGPKSPVRAARRSSLDRAGPVSCYAWGLIPLSYTIEALSRAGRTRDPRIKPAVNALLGAQRASGGWCRNLGGHPSCTLHALRAIGALPGLRLSTHAERALDFMQATWRRVSLFPALQAVARFDSAARALISDMFVEVADRQRKNGTFGTPCQVERVAAVLAAKHVLDKEKRHPTKASSRRPGGRG